MQNMSDMGFALIQQLRKDEAAAELQSGKDSYLKTLEVYNAKFEAGVIGFEDKSTSLQDIQRMLHYTKPDRISLPDGYLVLGSLTGIALSDSYNESVRLAALAAILTLKNIWRQYNDTKIVTAEKAEFMKLLNNSSDGMIKYLCGWDYNE